MTATGNGSPWPTKKGIEVKSSLSTRIAALAAVAGLAFTLTACSGDSGADDKKANDDQSQAKDSDSESDTGQAFGPACADIPKDGDGSFDGMAKDPVATAASNNPALSTLVEAVTAADLADTLNSSENITVFAPANSAFEKVPEKDLAALLKDKEKLTEVLTYHVVGETVSPDKLGTAGPFKSLQGADIEAAGSGEDYTVNGDAKVVCGNVETANATVYIIDTVLMPPADDK